MKIAFVVGTRPEIIKMSPILSECRDREIPYILIHSNQHYSPSMDSIFFEELGLPSPDYNLNVGSGGHANQTGNILIKIEPILEKEKPDVLLTQGDTNTVLAAGLAASKLGIKVGHVEAGLRSYDRTMPEETNRIVVDHLSTYLFSVAKKQTDILKEEGIHQPSIYQVGNSICDALYLNIERANTQSNILETLNITSKNYYLITAHRSSNVDNKENLSKLLNSFSEIHKKYQTQLVWPIHPRTLKSIKNFDLKIPDCIQTLDPVGYFDFLKLQNNAKFILTDSGGIQEEACILGVPSLTLRENTERPETVDVGASFLVGLDIEKMTTAIDYFLNNNPTWENPFGDGKTSKNILDIVTKDHK